jgi:hypothetical protein
MTGPEREPDLTPDEEHEIRRHAADELVRRAHPDPPDGASVEPRPPIVSALGLWWLLALGLAVGMAFIATDHMWRAGASVAASLWLAAALRLSFTEDRAGGLVVRDRWLDVTVLAVAGVLVALSAFTLDLRDLR